MKKFIKQKPILFLFTILLATISSIFSVFIAILLQVIIDSAINQEFERFLNIILWGALYLITLGSVEFLYHLVFKKFSNEIVFNLRNETFGSILNYNMRQFSNRPLTEYVSLLTNQINILEENYIKSYLELIKSSITFLITIFLLTYISPLISIISLSGTILMLIVPSLLGTILQKKQKNYATELSRYTISLKSFLSGFEVIKTFFIDLYINRKHNHNNLKIYRKKMSFDILGALNKSLSDLMGTLTQLLILFVSAYLVMKQIISSGTLVAIIQLSGALVVPIMIFMENYTKIKGAKPVLESFKELTPTKSIQQHDRIEPTFTNCISVSNLNFSYDYQNFVINNANIKLKKGGNYIILGPSGEGKSTFIKLLMGFYGDYDGEICYDDNNLKKINIDKLKYIYSTIPQNVYLFDGTIYENICLNTAYTSEEINNAIKISGVYKFIEKLPNGLYTYLTDNGSSLSGGQRQRIAVARALISNKPLLIIDEGTSSIDKNTALDIEHSLIKEQKYTIVNVTHNIEPSVLKLYDKVIFFQNGTINGFDKYEYLIKTNKDFKNFINSI
ncbi:ABC transporter ATP-binding protein [Staphylococcus caprae]|uniref:ABC transporter ATP-binding protein n=1 Tax=Staphylococcus TaxID=1279 RepID=UPI0008A9E922|nr:ABC transporter ATP-binding protein [Staphylococcus sp. HMSC62A08]OHS39854.1 hypothetical protein HMPREF3264_03570 [Staphylococcus sp. HMSC62A08]